MAPYQLSESVHSSDVLMSICSDMNLRRLVALTLGTTLERTSPVTALMRERTGTLSVTPLMPIRSLAWRFPGFPPTKVSSATMVPRIVVTSRSPPAIA